MAEGIKVRQASWLNTVVRKKKKKFVFTCILYETCNQLNMKILCYFHAFVAIYVNKRYAIFSFYVEQLFC